MENEFENKVNKAMKKFIGKSVIITQSGIVESKFTVKKFKYEIEGGILVIEDGDDAYLDIDIDDIENLYFESAPNGYALAILKLGRDIEIDIQVKDDKIVNISDKILKWVEEASVIDEVYKKRRYV